MTVAQIISALNEISVRAAYLGRDAELVTPHYVATQLVEIGRIAELTRDLIHLEGLQLIPAPIANTTTSDPTAL